MFWSGDFMRYRATWRAAVLAFLIVVYGQIACGDTSGPKERTIADYIVAVRTATGSAAGILHLRARPEGGTGPTLAVIPLGAFILGGTAPVQITSNGQFSTLIVALDGVKGYWELSVPATTRASLFLTLSQEPPSQSIGVAYAAGAGGSVGSYTSSPAVITSVGTGDIQISVSWDVQSDLDLHVVDPSGERIYFGDRISLSGGELDLDSNPACRLDGINNENVTWPSNRAPAGQYLVYVNLYASCGTTLTTYAVTVTKRGEPPQVFFGTVSAATPSSQGRLVTTLAYSASPTSSDKFTWPTDPGNASNGFYGACGDNPQCFWISTNGWRDVQPFVRYINYRDDGTPRGYHLGADWNFGSGSDDKGKAVYAAADGRVTAPISNYPGWGNVIFITHSTSFGDFTSMYAHVDWMDTGPPPVGTIARGKQIAKVGNGGGLYPYHLHFEIRRGSRTEVGPGYVATQVTAPPQDQIDPNAFIIAHR